MFLSHSDKMTKTLIVVNSDAVVGKGGRHRREAEPKVPKNGTLGRLGRA